MWAASKRCLACRCSRGRSRRSAAEPASSGAPTKGLRHIHSLPASWGRFPTCPGISSHLLSLGDPRGISFSLSPAAVDNGPDKLKLIPQGIQHLPQDCGITKSVSKSLTNSEASRTASPLMPCARMTGRRSFGVAGPPGLRHACPLASGRASYVRDLAMAGISCSCAGRGSRGWR